MTPTPAQSLKGNLIIAMPALNDPNFARGVVCMCEHGGQGSLGLVINRELPGLQARDIFEELQIDYSPRRGQVSVHFGGPVHSNEVFILHRPLSGAVLGERMMVLRVTPEIWMSTTREVLTEIAGETSSGDFIIALGCAGWAPGQLEAEIMGNFWLHCPADPDLLFQMPVAARWTAAVQRMGIDPEQLTGIAGHA